MLQRIVDKLPEGELFFESDQITDLYEKEIAADLIRSAVLDSLREEVPYSVAVHVEDFIDRDEQNSYIDATLFVERESQKGIVIGKGGEMLKKIGTLARTRIETMTGRNIYLDLHVKVAPNWRNDPAALKRLGYSRKNDDCHSHFSIYHLLDGVGLSVASEPTTALEIFTKPAPMIALIIWFSMTGSGRGG